MHIWSDFIVSRDGQLGRMLSRSFSGTSMASMGEGLSAEAVDSLAQLPRLTSLSFSRNNGCASHKSPVIEA